MNFKLVYKQASNDIPILVLVGIVLGRRIVIFLSAVLASDKFMFSLFSELLYSRLVVIFSLVALAGTKFV